MITRRQLMRLLAEGRSVESAAAELGVRPGLAYLVATGLPADGSSALVEADFERPGAVRGSTQHLSNPPHVNPTVRPDVRSWVCARATRDLRPRDPRPDAGAAGTEG